MLTETNRPEVLVQQDLVRICQERVKVSSLLKNDSLTKEDKQKLESSLSDLDQAVNRQTELCREIL